MKTPAPERAAGRKKLAAAGQALPDGTAPIPDLAYLKKAIRAKGRVAPAKWPTLKALIVKRARQLGATGAPGVKGTWAFQGANGAAGAVELTGPGGWSHDWTWDGAGPRPGSKTALPGLRAPGKRDIPSITQVGGGRKNWVNEASQMPDAGVRKDFPAAAARMRQITPRRLQQARDDETRIASGLAPLHPELAQIWPDVYGKHNGVTAPLPAPRAPRARHDPQSVSGLSSPRVDYIKAAVRQSIGRAQGYQFSAGAARPPHPGAQANRQGKAIEMATTSKARARRVPLVRGAADIQLKRTAPGVITAMHKSSGMKIGVITPAGKGYAGRHASGQATPPSGTQQGALAGLIAYHNQAAAGGPPAQQGGTASYAGGGRPAVDLAGSLPVTSPAVSSGDGPRVTTAGAGKPAAAAGSPAGLSPYALALYKKFIARKLNPNVALAFAKRADAMHAKAAGPKASAG